MPFQRAHCEWVETALEENTATQEAHWSESIAVGSESFAEDVKQKLGLAAKHRGVEREEASYVLRATSIAYRGDFNSENRPLSIDNAVFRDLNQEYSKA